MALPNAVDSLRGSAERPELFRDFYDAKFELILAYVARRVYDAEDALDLTAETFAQAFVGRAKFRGTVEPEAEAWLYRIAQRQLSSYARRGRIRRKALERLRIAVPEIDSDQVEAIERLAELDGLRATLRLELERISPSQRAALRLRVVDELAYPEVARRLAITEQAARARVSRGLRNLADALEERHTIEEAGQ